MFQKFLYCFVIGIALSTAADASPRDVAAELEDLAPIEALRKAGKADEAVALFGGLLTRPSAESVPMWDRCTEMAFSTLPDGRAVEFWLIRTGLSMAQRGAFVTMFDILSEIKKARRARLAEGASLSFSTRSVEGISISPETLEKLMGMGMALCRGVRDVERLAHVMTDAILQESNTFEVHNEIFDLYNEKAKRKEDGTLELCQLFSEEEARLSLEHILRNITGPGPYAREVMMWLDSRGSFSTNFFKRGMKELRGDVYDEKHRALADKVKGYPPLGGASARDLARAAIFEEAVRQALSRERIEDGAAAPREAPTSAEDFAKADWTEIFKTKVGDISHRPEGIQFGMMFCGKELAIRSSVVNGVPLRAPLILKRFSTREEFMEAMRVAGIFD